MTERRWHYAWNILLGVILIRGFAGGGINMTSGLFLLPVSREIGVGIGSLSLYMSISSVVLVLFLPLAGKLINKYDIRIVTLAGAALQAVSFAACGFLNKVYGWYLLAVPQAIGAAIVVNLLGPILINRWFSRNVGLMLGIQMACVSLFGAVLQPVTSAVIAGSGWRTAYIMVGGVTFAVILLSSLILLRNSPKDSGMLPYGAEEKKTAADKGKPKQQLEIEEKTALKSISFYLLLIFMIAITGVGVFVQHIPTYGQLLGYSAQSTGMALAFASVGSSIGSVAIGMISDRIGSLKTCYGIIVIGLLAAAGFLFASHSFMIFGLATFLHGLVSSGVMVLAPILTLTFYGQKDYEQIYAKVSMGAPLASILLIPAYGFIYDFINDYRPVLFGIIILLLISAFCIAAGWKNRCTIDGCPTWKTRK
ncbi:MFS transporter [Lactonifactor sp. BIOML-A3]|uniref:MFS transporter n=1 Tax=unclassified Lactonifactor TaxID=2636670 RepID=UPI0012AEFDE6|nr:MULTISPECIES: MFS transporter [unclassified Lactonifactor]MSA02767.1 MFS transporter [Lactonifactor sp. BIOML-A5]MSA09277.1 MFS transporter [Lactonifactor sp. BIOML-A4]MSA13803.1 MFS transporter [Lactonifactor sp. BIOML-A3]MSA18331.1 MFS transporter [Lactonifactor sp. BIOML-A2]MSA39237.1 MFS transporter [Lactonifactor sp. BIOML-A1]